MTSSFKEITITGPAGVLQTVIETPFISPKKLIGIVCHPHPLHEGTMNNKVVTTVIKAFQRLEIVPLRFNFRGVGASEGQYGHVTGELEDLNAVISWVRNHYSDHKLILAGFSFGSYIAARVATEVKPVALISIAPPVHHNPFEDLPDASYPWLVIQGEADEVVPANEVFSWIETRSNRPELLKMADVGHFFHGKLIELREALIEWLTPIVN